jgi:YVTN family beta-propeller protein
MRTSLLAAVCCVASLALPLSGQSRLLLVSQRDHTFRVFDPVSGNQLASAVEDQDAGHEVWATPDGKIAFVPIYGNSGVGKPGTDGDHIDLFDVASARLIGTIPFGHGVRPHKAIYDAHTGMLLVTTELDKAVAIIDPKTRKIVGSIPTGQEQSHMITLLPDGKKLYSANVQPGSVSVMDVPGRKLLKVIPVSGNTQRISSSLDGAYVFTADQTKPELVVIDTKTDEISKRVPLPDLGYGTTPTVDGNYLLVAMDKKEEIAVVDLKSMAVVKSIAAPRGVNEIVVSPDGKMAYASSPKTDQLAIIDLSTFTTTKVVPSGKYPDGMWLTR